MTVLDFTDSEPKINSRSASKVNALSGNAAFYERLQGTRKSSVSRYSWVALPIAAVAIIGVVAATSTPNRSADSIAAGPVDAKPAMAVTAPVAVQTQQASASVSAPQAAPAPIHVARRAAPSEPAVRPASAARPQVVPAPTVTAAPGPAQSVAPAAVEAQAPAVAAPPAAVTPTPVEAAPAEAPAP